MTERRLGFYPRRQFQETLPLVILWIIGFAILSVVSLQQSAPLEELFLDPASLTGSPWYTGLISSLGILCWAVAVTAGLGGAWVANQTGRPAAARFLSVGAFATLVLMFDDLLQFHAVWMPKLGVPKSAAQLLILVPTLVWLAGFGRDLFRTRWLLVLCALGSFAVSLMIDTGFGLTGTTSLLVEDGGKFLGVLAWAQYFTLTAKDIASSTIRAASAPTRDPDPSATRLFFEAEASNQN